MSSTSTPSNFTDGIGSESTSVATVCSFVALWTAIHVPAVTRSQEESFACAVTLLDDAFARELDDAFARELDDAFARELHDAFARGMDHGLVLHPLRDDAVAREFDNAFARGIDDGLFAREFDALFVPLQHDGLVLHPRASFELLVWNWALGAGWNTSGLPSSSAMARKRVSPLYRAALADGKRLLGSVADEQRRAPLLDEADTSPCSALFGSRLMTMSRSSAYLSDASLCPEVPAFVASRRLGPRSWWPPSSPCWTSPLVPRLREPFPAVPDVLFGAVLNRAFGSLQGVPFVPVLDFVRLQLRLVALELEIPLARVPFDTLGPIMLNRPPMLSDTSAPVLPNLFGPVADQLQDPLMHDPGPDVLLVKSARVENEREIAPVVLVVGVALSFSSYLASRVGRSAVLSRVAVDLTAPHCGRRVGPFLGPPFPWMTSALSPPLGNVRAIAVLVGNTPYLCVALGSGAVAVSASCWTLDEPWVSVAPLLVDVFPPVQDGSFALLLRSSPLLHTLLVPVVPLLDDPFPLLWRASLFAAVMFDSFPTGDLDDALLPPPDKSFEFLERGGLRGQDYLYIM
ncbi:hypothetical protein AURDEDRAFT_176220 [Auricularia subglabra TFB-10046 SS5]|uniref:Uncharacterized protein n=1 Tax=Auricularia subglabra (strain TFB-10046 / SS5) TaxID=717982 RepID=J0LDJ7_AURST|nr:hypothetical protein AURDEDRAFT_176220 [Auricularia subglabra TFB-10046 SS5]